MRLPWGQGATPGAVGKRKASGVPWDRVDEVRSAQGGLLNQIAAINRKLAHPGTSGAMRDLLVADLGRASRMLDFSEQFVPRIKRVEHDSDA
ncbi:polymorphic toxin type 28 domain-containing protein [Streptomyces sp. JV185]|uniref:polymorphic toxin type 28 domain-containing protein n=1 Tax=Streptomyces sp. JV185 TaxID=858638 RepID=UPI003FA782C9